MSRPDLRIGDLERDAAIGALGEHYAAGRLTKEEYDERADVAWRARTRGDLAPLFADLPSLHRTQPVARPAGRAAHAPGPSTGRGRRSAPPVLPVLLLVIVVAGILDLAVWPFVLLGLVYVWLRMWRGVVTARQQWARRAELPFWERPAWERAAEPWRRRLPRV